MSVYWSEVTIDTGKETVSGGAAAQWVHANLPKLRPGEVGDPRVMSLHDGKGWIGGALGYRLLEEELWKLGAYLVSYDPGPRQESPPPAVRRELINTLRQPPKSYRIRLELADINTLFPDIGGGPPWEDKGVLARLQALGYLYTPLGDARSKAHGKKSWEYYKAVHKNAGDPELLDKLKKEVSGDIVSASLPGSGVVFDRSKLPARDDFAAIRFPGGYSVTKPRLGSWKPGGAAGDPQYDFPIGAHRDEAEDRVFAENDWIGKIPVVAFVEEIWPDESVHIAARIDVCFRLLHPRELPDGHGLKPPPLRDKVMDYAKDPGAIGRWMPEPPADFGLTPDQWIAAKLMAAQMSRDTQEELKAEILDSKQRTAVAAENKSRATTAASAASDAKNKAMVKVKEDERNALPGEHARMDNARAEQERIQQELKGVEDEFNRCTQLAKPKAGFALKIKPRTKTPDEIERERKTRLDQEEKQRQASNRLPALSGELERLRPARERADVEFAAASDDLAAKLGAFQKSYDDSALKAAERNSQGAEDDLNSKTAILKREETRISDAIKGSNLNKVKMADPSLQKALNFIFNKAASDTKENSDLNRMLRSKDPRPPLELDGGPAVFVNQAMADARKKAGPSDPQRNNAPNEYKGKCGLPVAGNVFETKARDRFHTGNAEYGSLEVASDAGKEYTVKARTNAKGFAGVVFMPSRCGGDMYRLAAYVDPEPLKPEVVVGMNSAVSGSLVVWRNLRLHRYLRQSRTDCPDRVRELFTETTPLINTGKIKRVEGFDSFWDKVQAQVNWATGSPVLALKPGESEPQYPIGDAGRNANSFRPFPVTFIGLWENFRRSYCELIADFDGPAPITQAMLDEGLTALTQAADNSGKLPAKVDWRSLVFVDAASPFLLNIRHYQAYNSTTAVYRRHASQAGALYSVGELSEDQAKEVASTLSLYGIQALVESLTGGGDYPGFTVIQFPHGDTWDHRTFGIKNVFTSGWAQTPRACLVFYTNYVHRDFMAYSGTSNTAHELGHALMLSHQPPEPASGDTAQHQPQPELPLTTPAAGETVCVMSYRGCYGEYCGRCVLALRGWKVRRSFFKNQEDMDEAIGMDSGV